MMKFDFETRYKEELDRVCFTPEEKAQIARRAAFSAAERAGTRQRGGKGLKRGLVIAVAAVLMAVLSIGAVAGAFLLSPAEAAKLLDEDRAALAFSGDTANTDEQVGQLGDYTVRLCGLGTGEAVLDQFDCTMESGHTYVMLSYQRTDGAPIDIDKEYGQWRKTVFVSGLPIEVQKILFYYRGNATVVDGVLYELLDCGNLGIFADHTAYLAIYEYDLTDLYEQKFPGERTNGDSLVWASPSEAIKVDEDGTAAFLPDYPKPHALFTLTLDESGADPERAQEYLETFPLYQDWVAQRGYFESGVRFDPQCVDDILEIYRPYEKRGYIPKK